jgi:hypothetical protein
MEGGHMSESKEGSVQRVPVDFRYDAINPAFLHMLAKIAHYAAEKYGSWEQYTNARLTGEKSPINHIYEHLRQYQISEEHDRFGDPEWHLAVIAYNAMMEFYYARRWGVEEHPTTKKVPFPISATFHEILTATNTPRSTDVSAETGEKAESKATSPTSPDLRCGRVHPTTGVLCECYLNHPGMHEGFGRTGLLESWADLEIKREVECQHVCYFPAAPCDCPCASCEARRNLWKAVGVEPEGKELNYFSTLLRDAKNAEITKAIREARAAEKLTRPGSRPRRKGRRSGA